MSFPCDTFKRITLAVAEGSLKSTDNTFLDGSAKEILLSSLIIHASYCSAGFSTLATLPYVAASTASSTMVTVPVFPVDAVI